MFPPFIPNLSASSYLPLLLLRPVRAASVGHLHERRRDAVGGHAARRGRRDGRGGAAGAGRGAAAALDVAAGRGVAVAVPVIVALMMKNDFVSSKRDRKKKLLYV